MTRFVIGPDVALRLVAEGPPVRADHQLVAPTLLRSQVLSTLFEQVRRQELSAPEASRRLDDIRGLRIRLLGDRVLQSAAFKIAAQLGWTHTFDAEYVALTRLQADAFITLNRDLAQSVEHLVTVADISALA